MPRTFDILCAASSSAAAMKLSAVNNNTGQIALSFCSGDGRLETSLAGAFDVGIFGSSGLMD
jgi:hypothetical protein